MSRLKRLLQRNKSLLWQVDHNPAFAEAKARLDQIRQDETRTPIDPEGFDYSERPRP